MTATTATAVRTRETIEEPSAVRFRRELEERAEEFRMVLPSHIDPDRFQRTLLTAVQENPELLRCDRRSLLTSCMKSAQDGLLPDGRHAAIVPFKTRVKDPELGWTEKKLAQYMPMILGLRTKMLQSGEIRDLSVGVVYRQELEAGRFHFEEGSEAALRYKPDLSADFKPTDDDVALAFSVATFKDGTKSFEVMRRGELDEVREASQRGALYDAKGEPRNSTGPWAEWFVEMCKKTVVRRHAKRLPQSSDLIDVEGDDLKQFDAARSTVALLGAYPPQPAAPALESASEGLRSGLGRTGTDQEIDTRTFHDVQRPDNGRPDETGPEAPPSPVPGQPPAEEPPPAIEPATPVHPDREAPTPGPDETNPAPVQPDPDVDTAYYNIEGERVDQFGVVMHPAQVKAEEIIAKANACEFLIDLNALAKLAEGDVRAMPPEFACAVDQAFENNRKRLDRPRPVDVPAHE